MVRYGHGQTLTRQAFATTGYARSYEGRVNHKLDDKSALFVYGVSSFMDNKFYESATSGTNRFASLVHVVTKQDPAWVRNYAVWLRKVANMRSAPIVVVAEYIKAGGPNGRQLVKDVLSRADEPSELLGYWRSKYGRKLPAALKRGLADATLNLYNEYSAFKYDSDARGYRFFDVIALTHPKPNGKQELFDWLGDRRYGSNNDAEVELPMVIARRKLNRLTFEQAIDNPALLKEAGVTWEFLSSKLPNGWTKEAWEAVIPQMGYMALLRNLRNFENTGVNLTPVLDKLRDPAEVAKSKQLPFRFYSAYKEVGSLKVKAALEEALNHSVSNVPEFSGRTLVLVDGSGSMQTPVSGRSRMTAAEVGAVFGAAVALKGDSDLYAWADTVQHIKPTKDVLTTARRVSNARVGYGTYYDAAIRGTFKNHDRVVVLTDFQAAPGNSAIPADTYYYGYDLVGYGNSLEALDGRKFLLAGYTPEMFKLITLLESGKDGAWPWEL